MAGTNIFELEHNVKRALLGDYTAEIAELEGALVRANEALNDAVAQRESAIVEGLCFMHIYNKRVSANIDHVLGVEEELSKLRGWQWLAFMDAENWPVW